MNTETILIIGAGQAGGRAAETLRAEAFSGRIVIVGDEPERPYERPPLSKQGLMVDGVDGTNGESTAFGGYLHEPGFYRDNEIDLRTRSGVVELRPEARQVVLDNGEMIAFDSALVATGGRARTLPGRPRDSSRVMTLRTLADANRLRERMAGARHAVVIGAGFLGLEFASSACARGLTVTVIEAAGRLIPRALPAGFAATLRARHEAMGVTFHMNASLRGVHETPDDVLIQLDDGTEVKADFCVVAIGQLPNDELARKAGLAVENGIRVDAFCRTSHPAVHAAGDCASFPFGAGGRHLRLESWQNAQEQAQVAAKNMLGKPVEYRPTPWFWTDQCHWNIQMLGLFDGDPYEWVTRHTSPEKQLIFGLRGGRIAYALAVNSGADLRAVRGIVEKSIAVRAEQLCDPAVKLRQLDRHPE